MKITNLKYISFLLIFVSCTSHKTISNHWSKYVQSNFSSNNLSASRNTVFEEPKLKLTKPLLSLQDSVKILTKSGKTHQGIITKSDFKEILSNLKKDPTTKDADEVSIISTWTQGQLDSSQKNIPDGNYTVGDKIVTIKDKIVVDVN